MKRPLFMILFLGCVACSEPEPPIESRSYRMGFQSSAPRLELELILQSLNMWVTRADAAMITTEVPWKELLDGMEPAAYVKANYVDLVNFYRGRDMKLWIYIDPENGLKRESDAAELVKRGKSIAHADVQEMYRKFVVSMDSLLKPDHLGLALETNLIRLAAPAAIYNGVKKAANDAATEVRARNKTVKLSVSFQVEVAWGRLGGDRSFSGVAQDYEDFPFIEEVGISSYPYFGFEDPGEIPVDYYARLVEGKSFKVFITEGGWSSESFSGPLGEVATNTTLQKEYIARQGELLRRAQAIALFQLIFTDLDVESLPATVDPSIRYFSTIGLVDIAFQPKPALSAWDELFKLRLE